MPAKAELCREDGAQASTADPRRSFATGSAWQGTRAVVTLPIEWKRSSFLLDSGRPSSRS
ncbi:hypothetical protein BOS5A_200369 [Bosea sp. EC-HK365B]|nr:hypothetical protein BOSE21B_110317 [Bosea sp. 21B]CAD5281397.1 hypothetical protein BOSE7B_40897 [Bosea sp. 7B]VVT58005.1 hypothetical protein BOS5A_200369 [Bosea sp. EC-HK365B]VXC86212.1 hypothetical protein BOSE127_60295 [Bosea sp. 127]